MLFEAPEQFFALDLPGLLVRFQQHAPIFELLGWSGLMLPQAFRGQ